MSSMIGENAVVVGGSIAGLLTARVLSEWYDRVSIVERDWLPTGNKHRRGVPQGRHAHTLLPRATELLDDLFADLSTEL
ncbi:MAG TPA: FAD/NAD(P)-binding protein, partial [Pseudonocardiaceae bacterium]|nr:FAD/NAD(P)-binding protein [Pseudonocardiaceae bacterium]